SALAGNRLIGMVQPSDATVSGSNPRVYPTGCVGRMTSFSETDDGRFLITLTCVCRFRIKAELPLLAGFRVGVRGWCGCVGVVCGRWGSRERERAKLRSRAPNRAVEGIFPAPADLGGLGRHKFGVRREARHLGRNDLPLRSE